MKFETLGIESSDIERLHGRAEEVIEKSRIDERSFIEPYGAETVERDLKKVAELEAQFGKRESAFQAENKKLATIFEALILEHGELSNWFGENAITIATSKYDDYENGVDAVIEFQGPSTATHLGLAVDVTFTADTTKKFDRLKWQVRSGELAKVKYFHSEHMNIHGQLSKLPEVVVGASRKTVLELAEMWMDKRQNALLAEHRIQIMVLHQMQEQLATFGDYAASLGDDKTAAVYFERLRIVNSILDEKSELERSLGYEKLYEDEVHAEIMNFLARWKHEIASAERTA